MQYTDLVLKGGKPTLMIGGDKGGKVQLGANSMKFTLSPLINGSLHSVSNMSIFGIYKGMDTFENVHDFLEFTNFKITELRNHFKICYTGDFEFLYAALGLQGACSMYPNMYPLYKSSQTTS